MFIAALYIMAKNWKLMSVDICEWINKMGYVCIMQYSSGLKGTNNWHTTWMDLKSTILSEKKPESEDYILYDPIYIKF